MHEDMGKRADDLREAWDVLSNIRTSLTLHPETVTADRLRHMCTQMVNVEGAILAGEIGLRRVVEETQP